MWYVVIRINRRGEHIKTAETENLADAESVLDNWHIGFVTLNGVRVHEKNMELV